MTTPLIKLSCITKSYESDELDPVQVLKGVDLDIQKGDFIAIMGVENLLS